MTELARLLQDAKDRADISGNQIAKAARDQGHKLSAKTVSVYLRGGHGNTPSQETLEAFASVLPVPIEELRKAAGLSPDLGEWEPPAEARELTGDQRRAVSEVIRQLVLANRGHATAGLTQSGYELAAREAHMDPRTGDIETDGAGSDWTA